MKIGAAIRVALRSMRRTPLRSSLTALGIVIGVASIIVMVGLGNGAKARIDETLAGAEWDHVVVLARMPLNDAYDERGSSKVVRGQGITVQDYEAIRGEGLGILRITLRAFSSGIQAKVGGRRVDPRVIGWDVQGFEIHARDVLQGAAFGSVDVRRASSVCLITKPMAHRLFMSGAAIGRFVLLNRVPFLVIGVIEEDSRLSGFRPEGDMTVIMPFSSLLRRLDPNAQLDVAFKTGTREEVDGLKLKIIELLEQRRGNRKVEFQVFHQLEGAERRAEGSRTMTLLLAAISGVSLLVGGIGIMNIMLVNVTERTREIGVRLAIGTRTRDVLIQFLIEAAILSILGGGVGIALGAGSAYLLTYLNDWPTQITTWAVVGAFLCSAGVGIFFGFYPARQASRMDPIQALRSD
jgi:putative ABC transport system permease protein